VENWSINLVKAKESLFESHDQYTTIIRAVVVYVALLLHRFLLVQHAPYHLGRVAGFGDMRVPAWRTLIFE
jgi:hypothetical protein